MNRAVLYLRSSKDRSDVSIDAQRRALQELAEARGFLIVNEYVDAVESGKDDNRPGFQSLLSDMRKADRSWDHILVLDTARIGRRRALAIIFEEQECKKRGIRVIYKSLPESDPVTEMLLKSILQAMDEWHSLNSKVKGMAGMAENVKQGWRAGGKAPRGYRLQYEQTGAVRDGEPVTKSKLTPSDDALRVRAYLQHRAKGLPRPRALELASADWPISSLVDMERNALTYAGHTIWNRANERQDGSYIGGEKWKPRDQWVVQKDTHEPLISEEEAESILAVLESKKHTGGARPGARVYLLTGMLFAPDGTAWMGDSGTYRLGGRGQRIQADAVELPVLEAVFAALDSDETATAIAEHYRKQSQDTDSVKNEIEALARQLADNDRKASKLADLITQTTAPTALLRQIEILEGEREKLAERLEALEAENKASHELANLKPADVRKFLRLLADEMRRDENSEAYRDMLRQMVEKIELSPDSFKAKVVLRFSAPGNTGMQLASPRGIEPRLPP